MFCSILADFVPSPLLWFFHPLLLGLCKSVMRCHPLPNKGRDLPSQQLGGVRAYPTTAQGNSFTAPAPYRSLQPRAGSLLCPVCEKTMRDVKIVLSLNSESFISIFFDSWPLAVLPCYHTFVASDLQSPNLSDPCHAIKVIGTRCNYFFL